MVHLIIYVIFNSENILVFYFLCLLNYSCAFYVPKIYCPLWFTGGSLVVLYPYFILILVTFWEAVVVSVCSICYVQLNSSCYRYDSKFIDVVATLMATQRQCSVFYALLPRSYLFTAVTQGQCFKTISSIKLLCTNNRIITNKEKNNRKIKETDHNYLWSDNK